MIKSPETEWISSAGALLPLTRGGSRAFMKTSSCIRSFDGNGRGKYIQPSRHSIRNRSLYESPRPQRCGTSSDIDVALDDRLEDDGTLIAARCCRVWSGKTGIPGARRLPDAPFQRVLSRLSVFRTRSCQRLFRVAKSTDPQNCPPSKEYPWQELSG